MRHSLLISALVAGTLLVPVSAAGASDLVISEFRATGPSGGNDEFVEVRNTSAADLPIGGYRLQGCASASGNASNRAVVPAGVTLKPGQAYLFVNNGTNGYSGSVAGDLTYNTGFTDFAPGNQSGIRVLDAAGGIADQVGSPASPCREITGISTGTTTTDRSFERAGKTTDTDNNAADFAERTPSDPQNRALTDTPATDDPPKVAATTPANNAADVSRDATLEVSFSEPVTAQDDAFALSCDGTAFALAVSRVDADTYSLDPAQTLPQGASCTLSVEGDRYFDADTVDPPNAGSDHTTRFSTVGATGLRIHDIQAASHLSPYEDEIVSRVPGVVTAVRGNGFYMQDDQPDDDDATSEGILVFTVTRPALVPGQAVEVSGRATEFRLNCENTSPPIPCDPESSNFDNLAVTEIDRATVYPGAPTDAIEPLLVGEGGDEPPLRVYEDDALGNVEIGNVLFDPEEDGLDWHESHEGMLVEIANPEVVGLRPSFGELPVVSRGAAELRTPRGGIVIREGDMNPERFILDDVIGSTPVAQVGDSLGESIVAIADYGFGDYLYYPIGDPQVKPGNLQREVTDPKRANQLAIASMNVENLDGLDLQSKFDELASIVVDNLRSPDILAVEEMQDNDGAASPAPTNAELTYKRFIDAIVAAGGPRYEFRQIDPNSQTDGGEQPGNIRVGFLYRTDGDVEFVDRPGANANTKNEVVPTRKGVQLKYSPGRIDPANEAFNMSRKPLAAEFLWKGRTVFAIANHFNSKGGDDPLGGRFQPPVESSTVQRHKQATVVAGFVEELLDADPRAAVAVLGDLNDFQFSRTLEILEDAGLANLMKTLPENEQYSYVFDGNSQVLDQILVSKELLTPKPEYDSVHVNAEFTDQASDHDPQIARLVVRGTNNAK